MVTVPAGTPLAAVTAQFGQPTLSCPLPNNEAIAIWSQQPFGQYAWATEVDAQGSVGLVTQILDDRVFQQLAEGVWTPDQVMCTFGPPAEINSVGLPSVRKTVWSYRYKQYGAWNMLMNVFFDPETQLVVEYYPSPDPMFEYERWPFFF